MPQPNKPLPPEPEELSRFAAFQEWLRARDWEQFKKWREIGGENRGFKIAGVAGAIGLVLAVWLLSSWMIRSVWKKGDAQSQTIVSKPEEGTAPKPDEETPADDAQPKVAATPAMDVKLDEAGTPPADEPDPFVKPIVKKAAAPADEFAELPLDNEPKPVAKVKPVSDETEPAAALPTEVASLPLEDAKPAEPTPPTETTPPRSPTIPETEPAARPTESAPEVAPKAEAPAEPAEVLEPVAPIDEKPVVVGEKSEAPRPREEEGFGIGSGDQSALTIRGEAKETPVPAEKPAEKPVVEEKPAEPVAPVATKPEEPAQEPVAAPPAETPVAPKAEPEVKAPADDEPLFKSESTPLAPLPETPKEAPKSDPQPAAEKPQPENPQPERPATTEPPTVKAEPFADRPEEPKPMATQPVKPREMPPEEEPLTREPEKPIVQPASRQQPAASPTPALRVVSPPQIEFNLSAPLNVERGKVFKIGFQVANIGTTDINNLVFSIKLPPSLRHHVGREVEYHIDHLPPGGTRAAQMHVVADQADMALIRADMTTGTVRLASSDRQIHVRGTGSNITQRPRSPSMIVPVQYLAFPPMAGRPDCECSVP